MSDRYVVQIIVENASITDDEIVGCWRTSDAARTWGDRYERTHQYVSCLVKDLWATNDPPRFPGLTDQP